MTFKLRALVKTLSMLLVLSPIASAQSAQDIHTICEQQPSECLVEIESYLASEQYQSRRWYQYQLYKLDALFQLVKYDQLEQEIKLWIDVDEAPLKYRISVYIYYAKLVIGTDQDNLAIQYLNKAISILSEVSDSSYDPILTVQVANALNALGKHQQGYDLLLPLVEKYQSRYMPKFKHELYENLGHFSIYLDKLDDHLSYRLLALEWAEEMKNDTQIAISTYNIARAHQMLKQYDKALEYFDLAEKMQALGEGDQNMIWYRRVEISLAQNKLPEAEYYFSQLDTQIYVDFYAEKYRHLAERMARVKAAASGY